MNVESKINPQSQNIIPQENGILLTCQKKTEDSLPEILRQGRVDPQETIGSRPFSLISLSAKKTETQKQTNISYTTLYNIHIYI